MWLTEKRPEEGERAQFFVLWVVCLGIGVDGKLSV